MKTPDTLSEAAQFFYEHAGFSYDPKTETPEQGRARCAQHLAEAENLFLAAVRVADVGCAWEDDPQGFDDYRADKKAGRLADGIKKPKTIEIAFIWHRDEDGGETLLASLGGVWDAGTDYRRVVRAELALECADELRAIIKGAAA